MTPTNEVVEETVVTATVERSITRHLVKFQSWLIPGLLSIIGLGVLEVFGTVKEIAADNQRFNTYVITSTERFGRIEKDVQELKTWKDEHTKEVGDFWKEHGYMFKPKQHSDETENN